MLKVTRREVVGFGAAVAAVVPAVKGAARRDSAPNDARLYALVDAWVALDREMNRIARIASRRWGDDPENTPLAARDDAALARQDAIAAEIAAIPADTPAGMDAKWRLNACLSTPVPRDPEPGVYERVVLSARADASRLNVPMALG